MVDVEHDPRDAPRAAAAVAAEAIASKDPEAELSGEGIAGAPGAAAVRVDCRRQQGHPVLMERPLALPPARVRDLLKELRSALEDLYGANLVGIRLFGSYARRQATPDSDVDVLLVLRQVGDYGTEVRRVSDVLSRVSLKYGKTIAPVFVDADRFSAASDPFMANVAREAVPA